jgi:hypothetical protein
MTVATGEANEPSTTEPLPATEGEVVGNPAEAEKAPTPTPNVEEVLGFALPPNTVNSVTQAGVATRLVIPKLNLDAPVLIAPIKNQTWKVDHL